ncbi:MAG: hypothetical protein C0624_03390 [Desulfuromonas sp.]|nr:MAG: hypothetical protein C0624_03390 [Desulfuromonas sp.]
MKTGVSVALLIVLLAPAAFAADGPPSNTFSAASLYQLPADLSSSGELAVTRSHLHEGGKLFASRKLLANWGLSLGMTHYDFKDRQNKPWEDIYQVGANVSLIRPLAQGWSLLVIPGITAAGEAEANASDCLSYTLISAVNWQSSPSLRLGLGTAIFDKLGDFTVFPFIAFDWKPAPGWRLANPQRSGVTGPAGLELSWQANHSWTLGSGGAWQSNRFRLDDKGATPGGIGEETAVPVWVRLTRNFARGKLTLYAGATLAGTLSREDRHGSEVDDDEYDETPFLALYFSGGF